MFFKKLVPAMLLASCMTGLFFGGSNVSASEEKNMVVNSVQYEGVLKTDDSIYFKDVDSLTTFASNNNLSTSIDLEPYFYEDSQGNIQLDLSNPELRTKLNLSDKDLRDLSVLNEKTKSMDQSNLRGFVGLNIKLGSTVRGMSAVVAGGFAAGYCGFYLKKFAVNPITAGLVGAISAAIGGTVGWAVNNHLKQVDVGLNITGISMSYTVSVP
ncbi:hypothetical protein [Enterococcus thailandicus]|uniref:hypothetical protein n=1 Tax=Enterococcus thailandicus TaxID=417368 RepID=UPI00288F4E84|nr:hypothetical protein [Enterococcus thailandicus]MDT2752549.1 hypothetical protein [Enterococcus thailandicus]MDT2777213.1 hypothetical protein [Enterococcus thailandicus]MDT2795518.1 hypothetical protein [Enterococcus thailandicus]